MEDMESTVVTEAQGADAAANQPVDDAQATEVSIEEVLAGLNGGEESEAETVENEGDDGQSEQETQQEEGQQEKGGDKFSRRISAALRNQEKQLVSELGKGKLTKEQIAEVVGEHLARQMHEEDPEISVKAAKKILNAQHQERSSKPLASEEQVADVKSLLADGWTREELLEFAKDQTAQEEMTGGKSVRQAALSYMRRQRDTQKSAEAPKKKGAPPIARNTSAGETPEVDLVSNMTEAQYDRFMEDLRRRAMRGEKVRI